MAILPSDPTNNRGQVFTELGKEGGGLAEADPDNPVLAGEGSNIALNFVCKFVRSDGIVSPR